MRNFLIGLILVFVGGKYGADYLISPKFQEYGDRTKAPWTCQVNNFIGHMDMLMSQYSEALPFFQKTAARCPKTSMAEAAEFEIAECYSKMNNNPAAYAAYMSFVEKYPRSSRAKIAARAAQLVQP